MANRYKIILQELEGGGYVAYVPELSGASTQADTIEEARARLKEAVKLVREANLHVLLTRLPPRRIIYDEIEVED